MSKIKDIYKKREQFVNSKAERLEGKVATLQRKLLEMLNAEYFGKFEIDKEGNLIYNQKNIILAQELDEVYDKFNRKFQQGVLKEFGNDLLKVRDYSTPYYRELGFTKEQIEKVIEKQTYISKAIGITNKGNIRKNSFLDSLQKSSPVKQQLKDHILAGVAGNKGYKDYLYGMRDIIIGKDKGGVIDRYYRQYAYDSFNQVDSAINNDLADNLDLQFAIYEGSVIKTTRKFCKRRAGNVYHVSEIRNWNNLNPWAGAKTPLNVLIDRGGYNCRHFYRWVTKGIAVSMRPELQAYG